MQSHSSKCNSTQSAGSTQFFATRCFRPFVHSTVHYQICTVCLEWLVVQIVKLFAFLARLLFMVWRVEGENWAILFALGNSWTIVGTILNGMNHDMLSVDMQNWDEISIDLYSQLIFCALLYTKLLFYMAVTRILWI